MKESTNNYAFKKINDYILYKKIGNGANGEIYLSKNATHPGITAVKVINRKKIKDIMDPKEFAKKLSIMEKLRHKNLIHVMGKVKTANNYYIELEYANGPNLADYLKYHKEKFNKPLNEYIVQKIIRQCANGIEFLHNNKIMHRDIKLDNIMINYDNYISDYKEEEISKVECLFKNLEDELFTIKLCDFGYSKTVDDNNQASTICGTPFFMAPDVLCKNKDDKYGMGADLWSLGSVCYQLIVGNVPFYGKNMKDYVKVMREAILSYPKDLNISLESVSFINGLLQYESEKRMTFEDLWNHPFMKGKVKNFHNLKLSLNIKNKEDLDKIEKFDIDTKKNDNFIWLVYNDGNKMGIKLGEINENYLKNKLDMKFFDNGSENANVGNNESDNIGNNNQKFGNLLEDNDTDMRDITEYSFINLKNKQSKDGSNNKFFEDFIKVGESYKLREGEDDWEIYSYKSIDLENNN